MAAVKHLYTGYGDPNENPDLMLEGDAAGNHLYQDLHDNSMWIGICIGDGSERRIDKWNRLIAQEDLFNGSVSIYSGPRALGQMGVFSEGGVDHVVIAMIDFSDGSLRWRRTDITLGEFLQ